MVFVCMLLSFLYISLIRQFWLYLKYFLILQLSLWIRHNSFLSFIIRIHRSLLSLIFFISQIINQITTTAIIIKRRICSHIDLIVPHIVTSSCLGCGFSTTEMVWAAEYTVLLNNNKRSNKIIDNLLIGKERKIILYKYCYLYSIFKNI